MGVMGEACAAAVDGGHEGVEFSRKLGADVVGGVEVKTVEDELVYICGGLVVGTEGVGYGGGARGEVQDVVYVGVGTAYALLRIGAELLRCHA